MSCSFGETVKVHNIFLYVMYFLIAISMIQNGLNQGNESHLISAFTYYHIHYIIWNDK